MDKFIDLHNSSKLKQEEIDSLYSIFFDKEIQSIILKLPEKKTPVQMASMNSIKH